MSTSMLAGDSLSHFQQEGEPLYPTGGVLLGPGPRTPLPLRLPFSFHFPATLRQNGGSSCRGHSGSSQCGPVTPAVPGLRIKQPSIQFVVSRPPKNAACCTTWVI